MSRSTTSTFTHTILKYSRAYPKALETQAESDWQHFVNPVIRVNLDVKKSLATEELESVRLRVIWAMESGTDVMDVDQREFMFEDLDLLSYSVTNPAQIQTSQSLPIKAVFRESVVGIRYLHPRVVPSGAVPSYRRFQMTFMSIAAAAQFVDAICPVCPCKPNQPALAPASQLARQTTTLNTKNLLSRPVAPAFTSPALNSSKTLVPTPARMDTYANAPMPSSFSAQFSSDPIDPTARTDSDTAKSSSNQSSSLDRSAPSSFPSNMMPPPLPVIQCHSAEAKSGKEGLMESLKKTSALHNLSRSQLEEIVAQVVREDGFVTLLASLDSMWKVKGYLGH